MNIDVLERFEDALRDEEKSENTIAKYLRDARGFLRFLGGEEPTKRRVLDFRAGLGCRYSSVSANTVLSSVNRFLDFLGFGERRVRLIRVQRCNFEKKGRELSRAEYLRLLHAAKVKSGERLQLVMQTLCATGIRVGELRFITAEAVKAGCAEVDLKGKRRIVFIPKELQSKLAGYIRKNAITGGCVFVTRGGKPLDRSNIWCDMKKLCEAAGVDSRKVFPHNLRHLFARTFYSIEKDIVRLADILGHSSIETTRIYTAESETEHRKRIERLRLVL